jgi:hypothetical protein
MVERRISVLQTAAFSLSATSPCVDFLRILRIRVSESGYGRAGVPASVPKTVRRVPQVSIADDIIAIEHAASLVAAQFHGHTLGNAGTDHVADGRPPEVVRNTAGASCHRPRPPVPRQNLISRGLLTFAWPALTANAREPRRQRRLGAALDARHRETDEVAPTAGDGDSKHRSVGGRLCAGPHAILCRSNFGEGQARRDHLRGLPRQHARRVAQPQPGRERQRHSGSITGLFRHAHGMRHVPWHHALRSHSLQGDLRRQRPDEGAARDASGERHRVDAQPQGGFQRRPHAAWNVSGVSRRSVAGYGAIPASGRAHARLQGGSRLS